MSELKLYFIDFWGLIEKQSWPKDLTGAKQASGLQKATGDPAKRETSSAKLTEATTIEVDELDVVNRGNRGAVDELSEAN